MIMKNFYLKPEMQVVELQQQGCLMADSFNSAGVKRVNSLDDDMGFVWDDDGFDEDDLDM